MLLTISLFICNLYCFSQTSTNFVGEGKLYKLQGDSGEDYIYCANYSSTQETLYGEHIKSDLICVFNNSETRDYSSSHGNYIEIQHAQYLAGAHKFANSTGMLFYASKYGICAFTVKEKKLSLIKFIDDTLISVLDNNFSEGSDFSIYVVDKNTTQRTLEPSFYILNNGYLTYYNNISSSVSSVQTSKARINNSDGRKINLQGIEIDNPKNEIYIQDGNKFVAK